MLNDLFLRWTVIHDWQEKSARQSESTIGESLGFPSELVSRQEASERLVRITKARGVIASLAIATHKVLQHSPLGADIAISLLR